MAIPHSLHGINCAAYGGLYARAFGRNLLAQPAYLPELRADHAYLPLPRHLKEQVHRHIKRAAKDFLIEHGYPPDIIDQILG